MMNTPYDLPVEFVGPPLSDGPLPAFLYFSICAHESLHLYPYNSPLLHLKNEPIRIFSFTLPSHGPGFNKFSALDHWAELYSLKEDPLATFFEKATLTLDWLQDENWISLDHLAIGGLSRGAFIATHLAARLPQVQTVLGFAPLTRLSSIRAFQDKELSLDHYNLESIIPNLLHIKNFRFYIGNVDTLVGTDLCFSFIHKYALFASRQNVRHCSPELYILKAIGKDGHGTAPEIFQQGAQWIKNQLLNL